MPTKRAFSSQSYSVTISVGNNYTVMWKFQFFVFIDRNTQFSMITYISALGKTENSCQNVCFCLTVIMTEVQKSNRNRLCIIKF